MYESKIDPLQDFELVMEERIIKCPACGSTIHFPFLLRGNEKLEYLQGKLRILLEHKKELEKKIDIIIQAIKKTDC